MYREASANSEIHISHNMSKRFRLKREERIWTQVNDLNQTSKIEMMYNTIKGVQ
jgi:hypothetical protein